jgi:integrase
MAAKGENKPVQMQEPLAYDVAFRFLTWCRKHRAAKTTDSYKEHLVRFFDWLPGGKGMAASELKPYHVMEYMDAHEWGDSYKRGAAGSVQRAFKWAVSVGILDYHPCTFIPKPKGGRRESPMTEEEYREILGHAAECFRDVVEFAHETGSRPYEIRTMQPRHVDLKGQRVIFPREEAKGKKRARIILLNKRAMEIVERRLTNKDEWVFTNRDGGAWTACSLNNRLDRLKKWTGRKVAMYDSRHGFGTRKLVEGHSVETVAAIMGHSSPQMLHSVYGHMDKEEEHLRKAL